MNAEMRAWEGMIAGGAGGGCQCEGTTGRCGAKSSIRQYGAVGSGPASASISPSGTTGWPGHTISMGPSGFRSAKSPNSATSPDFGIGDRRIGRATTTRSRSGAPLLEYSPEALPPHENWVDAMSVPAQANSQTAVDGQGFDPYNPDDPFRHSNWRCSPEAARAEGRRVCELAVAEGVYDAHAESQILWDCQQSGYECVADCHCRLVTSVTVAAGFCEFETTCGVQCGCRWSVIGTSDGLPIG